MTKQRTIKNEISLSGVGLHTGCQSTLTLKPADTDHGIKFVRMDLPDKPVVVCSVESVKAENSLPRCTTIGQGDVSIHTVEHFLSVLSGLGITNLLVETDNCELPGLDGSGKEYLEAIQKVGVVDQEKDSSVYSVIKPIGVESNDASIYIFPSDQLRITYSLSYDHDFVKSQYYSTVVNQEIYSNEIAPSRTFCLKEEAEELLKNGLGKGANTQNTLVIDQGGVMENELRFDNEFARHKVLDFIGDTYLLGMPIKGHVYATKSGHALNYQLLKKIAEQKAQVERKGLLSKHSIKGKVIDIETIKTILPHRFPFLLVDRVHEVENGKKAIGIKNVTMNEYFFQGHFPTKPVMPGVLMIEALAQTGGIVVLTNPVHHGKVAFFMAANNVKFRKVVVPGDQLLMEVDVIKDKSKICQVRGVAKVNDEIVAEADMVFSFTDASYLDE